MFFNSIFCISFVLFSNPSEKIKPVKKIDFKTIDKSDLFKHGVDSYARAKGKKDYLESANFFTVLINRGVKHEDLYYNLGNAYYQAGEYGFAVYNYERALKLHPVHKNTLYNLKLTKKVISTRYKDNIVSFGENPLWIKIVSWFHLNTLIAVFLIFWFMFFGILIYLYFRKPGLIKITLITLSVIVGLIAGVFGLILSGRTHYEKSYKYGIVLYNEISVKEAPQKASNVSFKLHAGLKVKIGAEEKSWVKIILQNGMEGWVEKRGIGQL
jgi:tetratricopeptide (TPR) repeat protein